MNAKLKLVTSSSVPKKPNLRYAPRPVQVHYQSGATGHSTSVQNALVNATRRMLADGSTVANVSYEGIQVADLKRTGTSIQLHWKKFSLNIGLGKPTRSGPPQSK